MRFKLAGAAVLALGTIAVPAGAAEARDGCGPGGHRGYYGVCRPNVYYRPIVVRPIVYGYRRVGWYGGYRHPGWHRWGGYRHVGFHRRWGWHGGYRHVGWHGGWHGGWHHRW